MIVFKQREMGDGVGPGNVSTYKGRDWWQKKEVYEQIVKTNSDVLNSKQDSINSKKRKTGSESNFDCSSSMSGMGQLVKQQERDVRVKMERIANRK